MIINFTVLGNPLALKRHRTYTKGRGGRPLPYPKQVDPSKGDKADFLAMAYQHRPSKPFDCPVSLEVMFYFGRPKSHFGTGKNSGNLKSNAPIWHTGRPDIDNLVKFIADSLDDIFWRNDSQISYVRAEKLYSDKPRTVIKINTIPAEIIDQQKEKENKNEANNE